MYPAHTLLPFGTDCRKSPARWILSEKIRLVLDTLCSTGNETEAYNLIFEYAI